MSLVSQRVREETREIHKRAESTEFMQSLIQATMDPKRYAQYLANLIPLYCVLDNDVPDPLKRAEKAAKDFLALGCPDVEATDKAIDLAAGLSIEPDPNVRLAHVYVRYMADLNGGQILSKKLQPTGLPVSVYTFDGVVAHHIAWIRSRMDAVSTPELFISEVRKAFEENIQLMPPTSKPLV